MSTDTWGRARVVVLGLVVVLLAVVSLVVWDRTNRTQTRPWTQLEAPDSSTVLIRYDGSSCQDAVRVVVDEDEDAVVLTVYETASGGSCDASAPAYDLEVELGAPLSDRRLVDGAAGSGWWSGLLDR